MSSVRRWYIFLVATISLQAVAWAVIALLRNLLGVWGAERATTAIAFQVAVIVIGMPIFVIHWLWAQRLADGDDEERGAPLRRFYLYGNMALLLVPWLGSAYDLCRGLLGMLLASSGDWYGGGYFDSGRSVGQGLLGELTALLVLGLLWFYQRQMATADAVVVPPDDSGALIRRLYLFGFSLGGLLMTSQAAIELLRWVLFQLGDTTTMLGDRALINPITGLLIGLPLWVLAWGLAQALFHNPASGERERTSALRTFYLHAVVFGSAFAAVSGATLLLNGLLRQGLGLDPQGDFRGPLSVVLITAVAWAYHSLTLRADTARIHEVARQAEVRQLAWYLVGSIGLAAALIGLGGIISTLIRTLAAANFGNDLREQLAWSIAALAAGLPVWALIWRRAQGAATAEGPAGDVERGALARRIYLYGFLFVATLTILSGLVYIVFQLLRTLLGDPLSGSLLANLAHAIAFSLIAAGVLAYHGSILRDEGRRRQAAVAERAAALRVAVLDLTDGSFGRAVVERLRRELPGLALHPIGLNPTAVTAMGTPGDPRSLSAQLAETDLIVGAWQIAVPQTAGAEVAQAVGASPARKLLLPSPAEGWAWIGVEPWSDEAVSDQIVHAVRQVLDGESIGPIRPMTPLAIVGTAIGVILLLIILMILATAFVV
ncbi:MAG: DUF3842 family protein [Candidatus Viridilinea halotolerans]|uniref:DUF3842 family protein n=1 Tax=Candidatus Viridilinea halotolerans TaxID=2491704 RepID=A0A426TSX2_9CHLR|nr:MAG: DUF3842 family protein [Candidatus Viridilinea halotolerans]